MEKQKKKFWDTKVGGVLKRVAPAAIDIVGDTVPGGKLLKAIFNTEVMDNPDLSDEDKSVAKIQFEAALREYEIREKELVLQDVANARAMQVAAMGQDDLFTKRFLYYLASFIMISLMVLLILLFFVEIPEGNNEIIYMAIGIFMGIVSTVAAFFFGSSSGSKQKNDEIIQAIRNRKR